jgi:hypothetical protein
MDFGSRLATVTVEKNYSEPPTSCQSATRMFIGRSTKLRRPATRRGWRADHWVVFYSLIWSYWLI